MSRMSYGKDYYQILGVPREAGSEEIKKAYRLLALKFHPDRNPGNKEAEERFKEISEAYGVLIDPEKRRHFDFVSQSPFGSGARPDFRYSQEEIFRDIFNNPASSDVFSELRREFGGMGIRFDERFFENLFFGGRGIYFGGIMYGGPGGFKFRSFNHGQAETRTPADFLSPLFGGLTPQKMTWKGRLFSWLLRKFLGMVFRGPSPAQDSSEEDLDLTYSISLDRQEASSGNSREISIRRNGQTEKISVKVPAGVHDGTVLRLRGLGKVRDGEAGDLYLRVKLS